MDVREIYGASPWQREHFDLLAEETARIGHGAQTASLFTATPVQVVESSPDGHNAVLQPVTKLKKIDPTTGATTYEDYTTFVDTPVHFAGGGGVTATHPITQGDEGIVLHAARDFDAWRQSGGTQQPMDNGVNNAGNAIHIPGVRSDPRKIQQVSTEAHHVRSDDKKHVSEVHPQNGITHTSVDPSTAPASSSFDPMSMATKFIRHAVSGVSGLLGSATDGGTTHTHGVTHSDGAFMSALNAAHVVRAHPMLGALLSALGGQHLVQAHPQNGVTVSSSTAVQVSSAGPLSLSAPPGMLSLAGLASGSVGGGALASGAAASNVGPVGGDLAGALPNPTVVGLGHVDAHLLPVATTDALAAAAGVAIGGLYRNTNFVVAGSYAGSPVTLTASGLSVLCVRMS